MTGIVGHQCAVGAVEIDAQPPAGAGFVAKLPDPMPLGASFITILAYGFQLGF